jgi:hypothetical protein
MASIAARVSSVGGPNRLVSRSSRMVWASFTEPRASPIGMPSIRPPVRQMAAILARDVAPRRAAQQHDDSLHGHSTTTPPRCQSDNFCHPPARPPPNSFQNNCFFSHHAILIGNTSRRARQEATRQGRDVSPDGVGCDVRSFCLSADTTDGMDKCGGAVSASVHSISGIIGGGDAIVDCGLEMDVRMQGDKDAKIQGCLLASLHL